MLEEISTSNSIQTYFKPISPLASTAQTTRVPLQAGAQTSTLRRAVIRFLTSTHKSLWILKDHPATISKISSHHNLTSIQNARFDLLSWIHKLDCLDQPIISCLFLPYWTHSIISGLHLVSPPGFVYLNLKHLSWSSNILTISSSLVPNSLRLPWIPSSYTPPSPIRVALGPSVY